MHLMTKILIAAAAVLSVALATLTMAYTVNADRIVNDLRTLQASNTAAKASAQHHQSEYAKLVEDANQSRVQLEQRLAEGQRQLGKARDALAKVEGEKTEAMRARVANETELTQLTALLGTFTTLVDRVSTENTTLRDSELRAKRENLELADKLNDVESQRQVLAQTVRALEVTVADLRDRIATGATTTAIASGTRSSGTISASTYFTGSIRDIRQDDVAHETLVQVNVGSNDSVRPNTELFVTRNNAWIANLMVVDVDLNFSIAKVIRTAPGQQILMGDTVESKLLN